MRHSTNHGVFSVLFAALALAVAQPARALTHDGQQWTMLAVQGPTSSNLRVYVEVQPRFGTDFSRLDKVLLRPALGYAPEGEWSFWAGYAWQPIFTPTFLNEQRLWQQAMHEWRVAEGLTLWNRTRLEERFIQDVPQTAVRLRHQLRGLARLGGESSPWHFVWQEEVFYNVTGTDGGPRGGFDQNRTFVGIHREMTPQVRLEAGYLNNFIHTPGPRDEGMNHVMLVQGYVNFE